MISLTVFGESLAHSGGDGPRVLQGWTVPRSMWLLSCENGITWGGGAVCKVRCGRRRRHKASEGWLASDVVAAVEAKNMV